METVKIKSVESPKILVIDDEEIILELIKNCLAAEGFGEAIVAKSAKNGLAVIEELDLPDSSDNPVDILICDIRLPDMSGFEVCARVKRKYPDLPVILISGYDIEDIRNNLIESEADDFLKKPFSSTELATRTRLHVNKQQRNSESASRKRSGNKQGGKDDSDAMHNIPYIGDKIDDYVIVDSIGWGKSSIVYKVVESGTNNLYAMKMLTRHAMEFNDVARRFNIEIDIMSKIDHPAVIKFHSRGKHNGCPYLLMEFVNGIDLEEFLVTRGRIPVPQLLDMSISLAGGIAAMHDIGIVHRDIKLKNILYCPKTKSIKLSDFGIARLPDSPDITHHGFIIGTPLYMAPEIFQGNHANARSDIYSFGATVYHLATGSPPFVADKSVDLYEKHLKEGVTPMDHVRDDLPGKMNQLIVERCMAKDPAKRPENMHEIENEISLM